MSVPSSPPKIIIRPAFLTRKLTSLSSQGILPLLSSALGTGRIERTSCCPLCESSALAAFALFRALQPPSPAFSHSIARISWTSSSSCHHDKGYRSEVNCFMTILSENSFSPSFLRRWPLRTGFGPSHSLLNRSAISTPFSGPSKRLLRNAILSNSVFSFSVHCTDAISLSLCSERILESQECLQCSDPDVSDVSQHSQLSKIIVIAKKPTNTQSSN